MLNSQAVHIVLTRFNVKSGGKESKIRLQPNWLDDRFVLFDQYCFPSMLAQTEKNFHWLIYFDVDTPEFYKRKIEEYKKQMPQLNAHFVDEWVTESVHAAIQKFITRDVEYILTTRLDNDDAVSSEFVKILHSQDYDKVDWYYNFSNGLTYQDGFAYFHTDMSNAFLSRYESVNGFSTVWELPHPEVIATKKVTQIEAPYAWLQVIHGGNVSNRVRGRIESPSKWSREYSKLESLKVNPLTLRIIFSDYIVRGTYRTFRDVGIKFAKLAFKRS